MPLWLVITCAHSTTSSYGSSMTSQRNGSIHIVALLLLVASFQLEAIPQMIMKLEPARYCNGHNAVILRFST